MVTRWTYLGLALVVVGLLTAGVGAATHVDEQQCRSTQHVSVAPADDASDVTANATAYQDLSTPEQDVFRQALAAGGGVLTKRGVIDPGPIRYENRTYTVHVSRGRDCAPYHLGRVVAPAVGGFALLVVGLALTRGRAG